LFHQMDVSASERKKIQKALDGKLKELQTKKK